MFAFCKVKHSSAESTKLHSFTSRVIHPPCCSPRVLHTHTQGRDAIDNNNLLRKTSRTDFKHEQKASYGWVRTSNYFHAFMVTKYDISGRSYSLLSAQVSPSLLPRSSQSLMVTPFYTALTSKSEKLHHCLARVPPCFACSQLSCT